MMRALAVGAVNRDISFANETHGYPNPPLERAGAPTAVTKNIWKETQ